MKHAHHTIAAACLLLLLGLGGCGYNQSGSTNNRLEGGYKWNSLYREDIQSVAVPIFTNKSFTRGVEFRLTEAIIKEIEARAPYKVVPRERADTVLEGEITDVSLTTLTRDWLTNLPRETNVTLLVDIVWKDLRTGRILYQRRGLRQNTTFYETLGEGMFVGTQEPVERMATLIVRELQADW